jgi:hypothetical protein
MAKFDLEKYWDFRVWVKSQIAQLRALLNEYQQNGGGGGTGGGSGSSDFNPAGTYPNLTAGKATKADTATRATNADKATKATSATTAESAKTAMNADSATTAGYATTAGVAESTEHATTADFATDLTGRREATPEVFTYRPSAGEQSIKDDNAFIRSIKGNSVVWNQFIAQYYRTTNGVTISFENGIYNLSGTASDSYFQIAYITDMPKGHLFLLFCEVLANPNNIPFTFGDLDNYGSYFAPAQNNCFIYTVAEGTLANHAIGFQSFPAGTDFTGVKIACNVHDLTTMFGTGNEPTAEEFRSLYPDGHYPYNKGELRNLVCSGIKTVGFNQWDGTTQVGYINDKTGVVTSNSSYLCTDFIRVIPNQKYYINTEQTNGRWGAWYDANKNYVAGILNYDQVYTAPANAAYVRLTIKTANSGNPDTFCINLHHTGYRDGEYEPYKEVTHLLPLSQITNGEPLRKAGSVYDEINETEYIRRVGVRGYATGDKDDATLLTDGRYTNYPLEEPIVTPIEAPIDFNYYVEDFGTEEAILAENSAPFSADIIYQFNATDQVRNNTRNIQRLKKTAFTPSGTTVQYIRGDGSYGDVTELSLGTPIHDGEYEMPDAGDYDMQFTLTSSYYAKSPRELDDTTTIAVFVTAPEDSNYLAEYWFEFAVGETLPNIEYYQPNNSDAVFIINGDMITDAVNILHLISSDGGITFYGEITNYSI